jgi:hypothetical protein
MESVVPGGKRSDVNVPSTGAPRPSTAAPPRHAPRATGTTPATGPQDTVVLTAPQTPWPELERAGLVGATAPIPGNIGQSLSTLARQGLLDAIARLEANGVSFERKRPLRIPLVMEKFVPASAEEVVDALARSRSRIAFSRKPSIMAPPYQTTLAENHTPLRNLDDLRGLDGAYGAGPASLPAGERAAMEAAADLTTAGWAIGSGFIPAAYQRDIFQPFQTWQRLHAGIPVHAAKTSDRACVQANGDELLILDRLATGHDRGTPHRETVDALIALRQQGVRTGPPAAELATWRTLAAGQTTRLGRSTSANVPVEAHDLADPDAIAARIRRLDDLCADYLDERISRTINAARDLDPLYDHLDRPGTKYGPETRAAALRDLYPAASNRHGYLETKFLIDLEKRLEDSAADELELKWRIQDSLRPLAHARYPGEVMKVPDPSPGPPQTADRKRLTEKYRALLKATRSEVAASDGLDLVRMPVGDETEDERTRLFLDLAAARADGRHAADDYRAVMQHRRPNQSLLEAGRIYGEVARAVSASREPGRCADIFAALQDIARQRALPDPAAAFADALAVSGTVDDALAALRKGDARPAITTDGGDLVIGGVRLRPRGEIAATEPTPEAPVEPTRRPATRDEIKSLLSPQVSGAINGNRAELEPLYDFCLAPGRFSAQTRAETLIALMPLSFNPHHYLDVPGLLAEAERLLTRPQDEIELKWLTRGFMARATERKGPYGTDHASDYGGRVTTPPQMLSDIAAEQGVSGEGLLAFISSTRTEVRMWDARRFARDAALIRAHSPAEATREDRDALLRRMEDLTGDYAAGADAFGLAQIPIGTETEAERVALLESLGKSAAEDYRAILMLRKPRQDVREAAAAYRRIRAQAPSRLEAIKQFAARQGAPASDTTIVHGIPLELGGFALAET